ncbi:hypothetical protein PGT21_031847 [Puccinia graminis f. sp. tritici]|uniref:Uncharacterized protein n=1 Tax=Puccinia graminis f. sp. tritici TaxID=56615 RepID=A0A5B0MPW9_PUCGR|nr:hypothetical protein PGTUg99_006171 [Puccinia graminis f. sp. tritici]KAA1094874.1 hypothetical protein PGT21_031847 [Puccinia graminis f. sp. tritici]
MTPTGDDPASRHEMSSVPVDLHSDEADSPVRSHRHVRQASAAITRKDVWPTCAASQVLERRIKDMTSLSTDSPIFFPFV